MVGSMVGSMVNTYLHTLDAHMLVPSCQRRTHPSMIQTRRSTGRLSVLSQLCCFVCGFPLAAVLERALLLSPGPIGYIHTREVKILLSRKGQIKQVGPRLAVVGQ
jgi:hypothetical protein